MFDKLYVVTRDDLPPGAQAVQALHAAVDLAMERHEESAVAQWFKDSNTVVVCAMPTEIELLAFNSRLIKKGFTTKLFWEPDLDQHTAFAVVPNDALAQWFSGVPLALRKKKPWHYKPRRFIRRQWRRLKRLPTMFRTE